MLSRGLPARLHFAV